MKYIAEQTESYWLINHIFSWQYAKELQNQAFQVWKWKAEDNKGTFIIEDGNRNVLAKDELEYTSFPDGEVTLWFTDNVLLLPCEY
ncbi:hypothetical protein NMA52_18330 [Lewinella sp. JB7]|nr:DUF6876 family protein [Lewinella sp. JB7]MCP9237916.1 hypothetical protein [Lewinella sp. JB7]